MFMTYSAVFFFQKINDITYAQVLPGLALLVLVLRVLQVLQVLRVPQVLVPVPVPLLPSWQAQLVSFPVPMGSQPA